MAAELKAEITGADQLTAALRLYMAKMHKSMPEATRIQMRLLLSRNVTPQTPPPTKYRGEAMVKRDVGRAVRVLKTRGFESKSIRKLIRERNYGELQTAFAASGGELSSAKLGPFDPSMHESQRNSKGVVPNRRQVKFATADEEEVKAYIKRKQRNVGKAKGGWAAGIIALGGRVQPWISRHAGSGRLIDRLNEDGGFVRAENASPWADGNSDEQTVNRSIASRARAIIIDLRLRAERDAKEAGIK